MMTGQFEQNRGQMSMAEWGGIGVLSELQSQQPRALPGRGSVGKNAIDMQGDSGHNIDDM